MSKLSIKRCLRLFFKCKKKFKSRNRELITASGIALCILLLRFLGLLQPLEWAILDQFFHLRPDKPLKERIVIIQIDEPSLRELRSWPISDNVLAQLLQKLKLYQPRAIGLDIYRNLPVEPGYQQLVDTYKSLPNLIGIELLAHQNNIRVSPPPVLNQDNRVGFNNVLYDADGKVRRSLLYWHIEDKAHESFALKVAKLYLESEGIRPQQGGTKGNYLQLGKTVFHRFQPNDGGYVRADNKGYQILSNFPKPGCRKSPEISCGFRKVSLRDVLADKVPISLFKDQIVLIGSTAPSLQDFFFIPYSSSLIDQIQPVAGVELQAYFISELISAALQERPLLKVWDEFWECMWIFVWACLGAMTVWQTRRTSKRVLGVILSCLLLIGCAYLLFLDSWWIPVVPALLSFWGAAIAIIYQIANMREELKRSKEFLYQLINTIPDPIFVKNNKYQWIVLNDAYSRLIGYPKNILLEKSEYHFFNKQQADTFRSRDRLVFRTKKALEHEEKFTDANGKIYYIATKRSLHKDTAGNIFLIGVIRDITERKLREENLQRTAEELSRHNDELKIQEDRLRYLAYHDPLTGLANRKFLTEKLQESLEWAKANNSLLGLLFIDLDGFKQVNDTLGHEMGDRLLVTVAHRLSNCLRGSDTVARLGGDEFIIILRTIPNVDVAAKIAEKILSTITEPIVLEGNTTIISGSVGISIYPLNTEDMETLIQQADAAMYRAKHLGKNRLQFAD